MKTFNQLKKNLKKDKSELKTVSVAVLADAASQLLTQAIQAYGIEAGYNYDIYEADYDQINSEVFNSNSDLYQFAPEYIFLNICSEHLLKEFSKKTIVERRNFSATKHEYLETLIQNISSAIPSKIIITNFPEIEDGVFGNYANKLDNSFCYQIRKLNVQMMEMAMAYNNVFICDVQQLQQRLGRNFTFDPKMYINGDMVYSVDFLPFIAKNVTDIIASIKGSFKKCIILDLDNTMWGGIIGDDGIEGIQVGSLGIGKAFTELQLWIKQLKERGIIVAVCSKNTEEIAKEPFEKHPEMVLRLDDIAVFVANWETKVDNIRHIQNILNIGFDSMVFIDDNPFEREMVKSAIAEIIVPELPEDPAEYLTYLRSINLFETASFTNEDTERTKQYQEEAQRNVLQKSFANEDAFLESLGMTATTKPFDKFSIPRVAQLTQRSNQFNLRTIRYTEEDINNISSNKNYHTLSIALQDKFGDYGLIAVIILKETANDTLFIDTWIMSCRVLKRGVENFTLNKIIVLAKENGYRKVVGEYIPTPKNGLVKNHYESLGFKMTDNHWELSIDEYLLLTNFITEQIEVTQ
ncbi:MAG TPA: HAD-IIIC family phosphatase [Flavipsychrobacter sp.]|nr:HAD-IIIC family phosphatase [Flavipsychrobacter sp.]